MDIFFGGGVEGPLAGGEEEGDGLKEEEDFPRGRFTEAIGVFGACVE